MNRRIAVFTGTRAEYGLLYWLMRDIVDHRALELQVIVGAMHLSPEFGETWREIEADGFAIDARVEMLLSSNTPVGIAKSLGLGTISIADALDRLRPDVLVVLGDRFEALAVAQAALIMQIPIVHLHGGEITEGAYDDAIRHAITKMASLHCTAAEPYRRRVTQMGEAPDSVINVGAMGLDHLVRATPMPREEAARSLGLSLDGGYFLVTYHPVTAAAEDPAGTTGALLAALDQFPSHQVVLTYPNADNGGRYIIPLLDAYARANPGRAVAIASLGFRRYLAVLEGAAAMIGNSSSGIIEAPSFGVPTVNIGARQRGRLAAESVIDCDANTAEIAAAIDRAVSSDFAAIARDAANPYGSGDAARRIVELLATRDLSSTKRFYDIGTIDHA